MKVIAVVSRKGGTGKTTLSGHLAVQAELAGAGPVVLIDTDPQGSLSRWWNCRQADRPYFLRTTISTLSNDLAELRSAGIELVIIDTPPAITSSIVEIVKIADLVIIPVRPSPHDLAAIGMKAEHLLDAANGDQARPVLVDWIKEALTHYSAAEEYLLAHGRSAVASSAETAGGS